jgi:hypothetical protein
METLWGNCVYTNTALTDDGDVWWEEMTDIPRPVPPTGRATPGIPRWTPRLRTPNARFTAPASQCPSIAAEWEDPAGVPISAILFGGRRRTTVPLVTEANDWEHGVFLGSIMASEKTAAAEGTSGRAALRPDGDAAVLRLQLRRLLRPLAGMEKATDPDKLPKIFFVNWFRRDDDGRFLWPGFGENSRVLKWVFERVNGDGRRDRHPDRQAADQGVARHRRPRHRRRRPRHDPVGRRRRLEVGDPADPRALRPLRRPPPRVSRASTSRSTRSRPSSPTPERDTKRSLRLKLFTLSHHAKRPGLLGGDRAVRLFGGGCDQASTGRTLTVLRPLVFPNSTVPSTRLNNVSSLPLPTFLPGMELGAALTHEDRAGGDLAAAEGLHAEALGVGIATVAG